MRPSPFVHNDSRSPLRRALAELLDLAWPVTCAGCERWSTPWCEACARATRLELLRVRPSLAPHLVVHAATPFEGAVRRGVTVFKDEGRSDLAPVLGVLLRAAVAAALAEYVDGERPIPRRWLLTPVPSSPAATRVRGRFPLGEVVRASLHSDRSGAEQRTLVEASLLRASRRTVDQSHLTRAQRSANVAGAFALASAREGHAPEECGVVLVDDVVTSGATLASAHGVLVRGGYDPVLLAAVAATPDAGVRGDA